MACNCTKKVPEISAIALNAAGAVGRVVEAFVSGKEIRVGPEVFQNRISACMACEHHRADKKDNSFIRCTKCGCWLNGKHFAKASLTTENCPVGKWGGID
jgi:hypothetical protein